MLMVFSRSNTTQLVLASSAAAAAALLLDIQSRIKWGWESRVEFISNILRFIGGDLKLKCTWVIYLEKTLKMPVLIGFEISYVNVQSCSTLMAKLLSLTDFTQLASGR